MKVNELMIGDWVFIKDYPIKALPQKVRPEHFVRSLIEFEPIPLTPEILERNGFKPYIPENHLETVYACQDVSKAVADELYALWPCQDGLFYLLLRVDGKDMIRMNVHYVHQLQHALKLCGIDKTIEL